MMYLPTLTTPLQHLRPFDANYQDKALLSCRSIVAPFSKNEANQTHCYILNSASAIRSSALAVLTDNRTLAAVLPPLHRLVGLVVKASASRAEDPGVRIPPALGFFSGSSHTTDSKMGTPVATLPGAWCYRVSAGTGRPGVSIL